MYYGLFLYLVLFPFGQLASYQLTNTVRVPLVDILAGAFALCWLADFFWKVSSGKPFTLPPLAKPLLSFGGFAAFTLVLGSAILVQAPFSGALYLLRLFIYILFYFGVWELAQKAKRKAGFLDLLLIVGFFIAVGGLLGYWMFPDTRALSEYGWDNHYYRLIGSFLDPAFTGITLVLFLVLVVASRVVGINGWAIKLFLFSAGWVSLALTYSRASYLAAIAAFVVFVILRKSLATLLVGVPLFLFTFFLLPHPHSSAGTNIARTQTIVSRISNQEQAISVGFKSPVFGVGYNLWEKAANLDSENKISHAGSGVQSSVLFVFATTGVGGVLVFVSFCWKIAQSAFVHRKSSTGVILLCSTAALFVHSLFDNSVFYPWVMGWMGILLGSIDDS